MVGGEFVKRWPWRPFLAAWRAARGGYPRNRSRRSTTAPARATRPAPTPGTSQTSTTVVPASCTCRITCGLAPSGTEAKPNPISACTPPQPNSASTVPASRGSTVRCSGRTQSRGLRSRCGSGPRRTGPKPSTSPATRRGLAGLMIGVLIALPGIGHLADVSSRLVPDGK